MTSVNRRIAPCSLSAAVIRSTKVVAVSSRPSTGRKRSRQDSPLRTNHQQVMDRLSSAWASNGHR